MWVILDHPPYYGMYDEKGSGSVLAAFVWFAYVDLNERIDEEELHEALASAYHNDALSLTFVLRFKFFSKLPGYHLPSSPKSPRISHAILYWTIEYTQHPISTLVKQRARRLPRRLARISPTISMLLLPLPSMPMPRFLPQQPCDRASSKCGSGCRIKPQIGEGATLRSGPGSRALHALRILQRHVKER